jgi:oxygen-independent coproporphyrinogen-3 oxidase
MADFVTAVLAEAESWSQHISQPFETVYFGGGTPTALSTTHLQRLIEGLAQRLPLHSVVEFTCEANPRTVTPAKATMMREGGVNRVSLGIQAWDTATLTTLGRDHSPEDALETVAILQQAGFRSLNLDLMFSIPGQPLDAWQETLKRTLALRPQHISAYNLNYEEDTEFFQRLRRGHYQVDEERDAAFFFHAHDVLESEGYLHYEISNYALPGHESLHNAAYWRGEDYLGLGPGAWSTVKNRRWQNVADTAQYIQAAFDRQKLSLPPEHLTAAELRTERFGLELRTSRGLAYDAVRASERVVLDRLVQHGLLWIQDGRIRLTREGMPLVDSIAVALLGSD